MTVRLTGNDLGLEDVAAVARAGAPVDVDAGARARVRASHALLEGLLARGAPVYGVNTGAGALSGHALTADQVAAAQASTIRANAAGVGDPFPDEVVRAMILLRANSLAKGYSGCAVDVIDALLALLNRNVHPVVPAQGSVGASGDLAPLAHVALVLLGEGEARVDGRALPGAAALERAGLRPLRLGGKDAAALINGTQAMTALLALALVDARRLATAADVVATCALEGLDGLPDPFDPRIHAARPHAGQAAVARNVTRLLRGSRLGAPDRQPARLQDAYSLRCIPQVHGACRETLDFCESRVSAECNAAIDNPLIFPDPPHVASGGNFHGELLGYLADFVAIALTGLAGIGERRIARLVDGQLSGLQPFLAPRPGLQSGFMLAQYTAAALVSESKSLAFPGSVDSIPTSANQEDYVSMGTIAARKARRVLEHAQLVVAIEWLCAVQAMELRGGPPWGVGPTIARDVLRERVRPLADDRVLAVDIAEAVRAVRDGTLVGAVRAGAGPLE